MPKHSASILSSVGAVLTSLLSCATCPMCLPIYAGALSLVGFELTEYNAYFFPIMIVFLVLTLLLMGRQILKHNTDARPLALGIISALAIATSTWQGNETLMYACLAGFMASVFWNKSNLKKASGCHDRTCCDGHKHD